MGLGHESFYADQISFSELHSLALEYDPDGSNGLSFHALNNWNDKDWCDFFVCEIDELGAILSSELGREVENPIESFDDYDDEFYTLQQMLEMDSDPSLSEEERDYHWAEMRRRKAADAESRYLNDRGRAWDDYDFDDHYSPTPTVWPPKSVPHHLEVIV